MDEAEILVGETLDDDSNADDGSVVAPTVATEDTGRGDDDHSEVTAGEEESTLTPKPKKRTTPIHRKGRSPAVKGLTIPFRTVKKVCG